MPPGVRVSLLVAGSPFLLSLLACPIQRPTVPLEYYDFRVALETAVSEAAAQAMREQRATQQQLDRRFPDLAATLRTDSLVARLEADPLLAPLAAVVAEALAASLESGQTGNRVRRAFRNADGQRLAVDAVLIGLGRALRRLRLEEGQEERGS